MRKILNSELGRPSADEFAQGSRCPVVVVLDNVRSLNNVGSFFRTCDAFATLELWLCGITATPPNRDIHKTALGAEMTMPWRHFEHTLEAVDVLKKEGYKMIAIEQVDGAIMLDRFEMLRHDKYAIVFGNEVNGVDQDVVDACHMAIEIPQLGTKHSLNVSVSGGVVLWEFFKQWRAR